MRVHVDEYEEAFEILPARQLARSNIDTKQHLLLELLDESPDTCLMAVKIFDSFAIEWDVEELKRPRAELEVWLHGFMHNGSRTPLRVKAREPQHDNSEGGSVHTSAAGTSERAANLQHLVRDRDNPIAALLVKALETHVRSYRSKCPLTKLT